MGGGREVLGTFLSDPWLPLGGGGGAAAPFLGRVLSVTGAHESVGAKRKATSPAVCLLGCHLLWVRGPQTKHRSSTALIPEAPGSQPPL